MAETSKTISLNILEREYRVNCPAGAEEELREAGRYLNDKMSEIKQASSNAGKVLGTDLLHAGQDPTNCISNSSTMCC